MTYKYLIPFMTEYASKFKQLDSLDFKIIKAVYTHGIYNLSRIADAVGAPQQTVSYHVKRMGAQDIVRFRALINEPKLGLKSYSVIASTSIGKEEISSSALTCFPLWRYLAIMDGWTNGSYVRYAVPSDKERDLIAFLNELEKRELITDFEINTTMTPTYPLLNLDFYSKKQRIRLFDWKRWIDDFDLFSREELSEPENYEKTDFDLIDLIILRCLELDARTNQRKIVKEVSRILKDNDYNKFIPLVSRRIRKRINPEGLINGYRAYLFPNQGATALFLMFYLAFSNSSNLEKFVSALKYLPFNIGYEKILGKDALFVRIIIPAYECSNLRKSLARLAEKGHLKDARLFFGDLNSGTWDNVEIYQMFNDETWNFSYGVAIEMLEKIL